MTELEIMARTVWGEARGEGTLGMEAVAWVIKNRAESPITWWGNSISGVCKKQSQFSCWNFGDPNYPFVTGLRNIPDVQYAAALSACEAVVNGQVPDPTDGATHYYAITIAKPSWAKQATFTVQIGNHRFYKDVP